MSENPMLTEVNNQIEINQLYKAMKDAEGELNKLIESKRLSISDLEGRTVLDAGTFHDSILIVTTDGRFYCGRYDEEDCHMVTSHPDHDTLLRSNVISADDVRPLAEAKHAWAEKFHEVSQQQEVQHLVQRLIALIGRDKLRELLD